ncbi:MAG TPA: menaquinone biosynthesis decarboxylase [Bacteroidales bacterium]|nr:menaquinone biosynthesis decarboxylase [Bacteroidales bacterium]HSA43522.1 menaquinone biosynthesis decarboxylase [Bacteroidales bacterium]
MAYKNLRQYIDFLETKGELSRVKAFVSPLLEMAEIADRLVKSGGRAVLFENNGSEFPVLMNAFGTERRMCMALGVSRLDDVADDIAALMQKLSKPRQGLFDKLRMLPSLAQMSAWFPVQLKGRGACQEIVMDPPDLGKLPVLQCWPHDGGRFITLPLVHTRDPESGTRNTGMYRMQVYDGLSTGMHWHLHKNSARHFHAYRRLSRRMPVAVTLGGDPVYTYVATAPMPDQVDEYLLAGFLRKRKVEMVKCLTVDLEVPADADFVIEGYVDPGETLRSEGPFGDHTGFYSLPDLYPVFHVTCITHRRDAIYPATVVGIPPQEDLFLGLATERIFLNPIRMTIVPELLDMHMPAAGVFHNLVISCIRPEYPGQAVKVMNALWGAGQMMLNKVMVVLGQHETGMDASTPPSLSDYRTILDGAAEGFDPGRDVHFSRGPLDVLDHAGKTFAYGGKMGIDLSAFPLKRNVQKDLWKHFVRIIPIKKTKSGEVRQEADRMSRQGELEDLKILVFIEEFLDPEDHFSVVWRVLNNIDPAYDCFLIPASTLSSSRMVLVIDGTRKYPDLDGFNRPWPNCTVSSVHTIRAVDEKWMQLGLGPLTDSPSLRFQHQCYPGGAEAE